MANILKELRKERNETQSEIAANLKMSQQNYQKYENADIGTIANATLVKFADYFGKSIEYMLGRTESKKKGVKIPVYSSIPAGIPVEQLDEVIVDEEEIPEKMASTGTYFCLVVSGDSMTPLVLNKDVAVIKKQDDCNTNEIAAVHINGDGATLKRIKKEKNGLWLVPQNETYKPMFFKWEDVTNLPIRIIGKLVEIRRKF